MDESAHPEPFYDVKAQGLIILEASDTYTVTTGVPKYTLLGLIEAFGGLAVVVLFFARNFVSVVESRLMEAELISQFYQVERPKKVSADSTDDDRDKNSRAERLQPQPLAQRIGKLT